MARYLGEVLREGRWNYCPRCDTQTLTRTGDSQWDCATCGITMMWTEPSPFMLWSDALTVEEAQREYFAIVKLMEKAVAPQIPPWRVRWAFKIGKAVMWPLGCIPVHIRDKKQKQEVDHEQS